MTAYDTYTNANTYFASRLHVIAWNDSTTTEKTTALIEASTRIDRLHFRGKKVDDAQDLEFPRYYGDEADGTEVTPDDIKIAAYEVAFALLDGVDPEFEMENLAISSQGFSSIRNTYSRGEAPEHIAAGIPSAYAWRFLKPYLAKSNVVRLKRVS
ncbi:unnamed protein product [marine sediment metagenome]|uniref:Putative DnaT-like domain-containing protein n=1 Tax=marine sediment metagenome TaxID=412755 RepID=X1LEU0_9ZZZZ